MSVNLHNIRDWTSDKHHVTDDEPFGGGGGMVMKPEPIFAAVEGVLGAPPSCPVILLTPQGRPFTQQVAQELAGWSDQSQEGTSRLALICGRYEGVDERVRQHLATDEISIGDYVITGGELAALVVIDAVSRLVPGVLGDPDGGTGRLARLGTAGIPALHPPGGVPRLEGAGCAGVGRPCPGEEVEEGAGAAANVGEAQGFAGEGGIDGGGEGVSARAAIGWLRVNIVPAGNSVE